MDAAIRQFRLRFPAMRVPSNAFAAKVALAAFHVLSWVQFYDAAQSACINGVPTGSLAMFHWGLATVGSFAALLVLKAHGQPR